MTGRSTTALQAQSSVYRRKQMEPSMMERKGPSLAESPGNGKSFTMFDHWRSIEHGHAHHKKIKCLHTRPRKQQDTKAFHSRYSQTRLKVELYLINRGTDSFWINWTMSFLPEVPTSSSMHRLDQFAEIVLCSDSAILVEVKDTVVEYFSSCHSISWPIGRNPHGEEELF